MRQGETTAMVLVNEGELFNVNVTVAGRETLETPLGRQSAWKLIPTRHQQPRKAGRRRASHLDLRRLAAAAAPDRRPARRRRLQAGAPGSPRLMERVDVLVVGGGVTGLASARAIAERLPE